MVDGQPGKAKEVAARIGCVAVALGLALACVPPAASAATLFLTVLSPAVTLTPTAADYAQDYVEVTGASGITLLINTPDPVDMSILVRCADPSPRIALNDFLVRTTTPPGAGGSSLASYTPISATNLYLWGTGSSRALFFIVRTDIRIRNLINYDDSSGGGTTGYMDTLVFTVVSP